MNTFLYNLVIFVGIIACISCFALMIGISPTAYGQTITLIGEYSNVLIPSSSESSYSNFTSTLVTNSNVTITNNTTQLINNENNLQPRLDPLHKDAVFLNSQLKNEIGLLSNTSIVAASTSLNDAGAESSTKVTADFNGDGYDDLAIGIPFEDEEIDGGIITDYPITNVFASGNDGNVPVNVLDNDFNTRWSSSGIGQFITADLGSPHQINQIDIAWYNGNSRKNHFIIATSIEGTVFTNRLSLDSSGTTTSSETYTFPSVSARYVKVTVNGNTQNNWASITEINILGSAQSHTIFDSGSVEVIYGSSKGLSSTSISPSDGKDNELWTQSIRSDLESYDGFGSTLATGDFNNDGFGDLAIGVPNEDLGTMVSAGAVNVLYGTSTGLSVTGNQVWTQQIPFILDGARAGDWFGYSLTTGDFNNDGFGDLAIGVPREDVLTENGHIMDAGEVNIIYGSAAGLNSSLVDTLDQHTPLDIYLHDSEPGDWFGYSLTSGDFNNDGYSELVVGVPSEDVVNIREAGAVNVIYFGVPSSDSFQVWNQNSFGIDGDSEEGDLFGSAVATGDFNKDGISDLAIGTPREDVDTIDMAGAVNVMYGSSKGLWSVELSSNDGKDAQFWMQDNIGIDGDSEEGDLFGSAVATGDFNKDGISDLAIGTPREDVDTIDMAGAVNVMYGSSEGLSPYQLYLDDGRNAQFWTQDVRNVQDNAEILDIFGSALATGDFNKDGISDLAIGTPREDVDTISNAGAVNVIYGSLRMDIRLGGLSSSVPINGIGLDNQIWTQNSLGVEDTAEDSDEFGSSLR